MSNKLRFSIIALCFLSPPSFCDEIELLKKIEYPEHPGVSMYSVLDNFKDCSYKKWSIEQTNQGERVIQYACKIASFDSIRERLFIYASRSSEQSQAEDLTKLFSVDVYHIAQWDITLSGDVSLKYTGSLLQWQNKFSPAPINPDLFFKKIYENKIEFNNTKTSVDYHASVYVNSLPDFYRSGKKTITPLISDPSSTDIDQCIYPKNPTGEIYIYSSPNDESNKFKLGVDAYITTFKHGPYIQIKEAHKVDNDGKYLGWVKLADFEFQDWRNCS